MKSKRLISIALASIRKNKMRTLLTMLGIIIGVGAVIVMVAIGQGAKTHIQKQIDSLGTNLIVITPGAASTGGVSMGAGTFTRLSISDYEAIRNQSFLLTATSPVIMTGGQIVGGQGNWHSQIYGVSPEYSVIRDWQVTNGRFFDQDDTRSMRRVAVLGSTVANALFPDQDPVGQMLRIRDVPFDIIGVLATKGQTAEGRDQDDVILAPYTTVQTRLAGHQFVPQILASTGSRQDIPAAEEEIRGILRDAHKLASYDENDFTVRNQTDLADAAQGTAEVMTLLLAAIASISLVVGGIGIMNIMLVSVTERTYEIGIRMAVGARGGDVMKQFLVESVVMSVLGGAIGLGLGFASAELIGRITGWSTAVATAMPIIAIGFSAAVGIFFGYYPARRAAGLDPIQALRHE
jgi:putative ABC transport system permease protein